jgi:hypothetical protein
MENQLDPFVIFAVVATIVIFSGLILSIALTIGKPVKTL